MTSFLVHVNKQLLLIPLNIYCFNEYKLQHRRNNEKKIKTFMSRGQRSKKKDVSEHSISCKTFEIDFVSQKSLTSIILY